MSALATYWDNASEATRIEHCDAIGCNRALAYARFQPLLLQLCRSDREILRANLLDQIQFDWAPLP